MLLMTVATTGLGLLTPLILRELIDKTLPAHDLKMLLWFTIALVMIPLITASSNVLLRQFNARVGEGIHTLKGRSFFLFTAYVTRFLYTD